MDQQGQSFSNNSGAGSTPTPPTSPVPNPDTEHPDDHKKNKALLIISFIVLVLIIAVLSYFLYDAKADSGKITYVQNDQSQSEQSSDKSAQENASSLAEYRNDEYGFEFSYPKEWGEATLTDGPETAHLVKGSEKLIKFSGNPNVSAGFKSSDWEHDPNMGHGGMAYPGFNGFDQFISNTKEYISAKNIYTDTGTSFTVVNICSESCTPDYPKTLLNSLVKLDNSKIDGVEFYYYGDVLGMDYLDKNSVWDWDKVNSADASVLMPKTDFRVIQISKISESTKAL